ncbi:SOS response-associated peptidase [Bosea sp. SSUT16]|uniref:SOS response-associated peptidase n=1 Tax=Bosea spartocytisi TaxID=2773451 RepID=A0A927EDS3_9HYPH|nr:SOS response-associated peptidase [Bosea spartocytisi]MBD3849107.1 SOS response-associated peptidase [Bosea spartocytisi]
MTVKPFNFEAPLNERRVIVRRSGDEVEMVELPWGLRPRETGARPCTVVRAEGRTFPSHRCLVPATEFRHRSNGNDYSFRLADGDWFYFAGMWRPATRDWPEAYAIVTIESNGDIAPYHDRQMAVLRRNQRMRWLDETRSELDVLRPLPAGSFRVSRLHDDARKQPLLAL